MGQSEEIFTHVEDTLWNNLLKAGGPSSYKQNKPHFFCVWNLSLRVRNVWRTLFSCIIASGGCSHLGFLGISELVLSRVLEYSLDASKNHCRSKISQLHFTWLSWCICLGVLMSFLCKRATVSWSFLCLSRIWKDWRWLGEGSLSHLSQLRLFNVLPFLKRLRPCKFYSVAYFMAK